MMLRPLRNLSAFTFVLALWCAGCAEGSAKVDDLQNDEDSGAEDNSMSDEDTASSGDSTTTAEDTSQPEVVCDEAEPVDTGGELTQPWDWAGVIGTGQSLAVGEQGQPIKSTMQPYGNLKLSTGTAEWPLDSDDASFELVPLVEPIGRRSTAYPSSYPTNISGETPHASMANQISALAQEAGAEYVGVHGEFGENGQCLGYLIKDATPVGVNGHAYEATLMETRAITRLAEAAGKTYGVGGLIVTHGECDAGNTNYEESLYQLLTDYNADIKAITGQSEDILMIVSQQNTVNNRAASTLAAWRLGVNHPEDVVCSGPKYQYRYAQDNIHLITDGYRALGEKYGQIYFERVVMGRNWQPLQPETATRAGRVIDVKFHVPVPPLTWDMEFDAPHQDKPEWEAGNGFELFGGGKRITIESVEIVCDNVVRVTAAEDLPAAVTLGYAMTDNPVAMSRPYNAAKRWGRLKDSDPFVGSVTGEAQPNYAVAFELPVE